jgi:hypothetical protein
VLAEFGRRCLHTVPTCGQLRPEIRHVFEGRIAKGPALFGSAMSYLILSLDNCAKEGAI